MGVTALGTFWLGRGSLASAAPTPACDDHGVTEALTEGPFYTPESPQKGDMRAAMVPGQRSRWPAVWSTLIARPCPMPLSIYGMRTAAGATTIAAIASAGISGRTARAATASTPFCRAATAAARATTT